MSGSLWDEVEIVLCHTNGALLHLVYHSPPAFPYSPLFFGGPIETVICTAHPRRRHRLLGVPKAFKMALQAKSQAEANKSLVVKLLRRLAPAQPPSPTVVDALGVYAPPAIVGALVLTGVLGATFGPTFLDVLG